MRGVLREALKEKRDPNCERKGSGVVGWGAMGAGTRGALGWGPAGLRVQAGRAPVTSRPGPLPLAGWVGPRRAERARGQGGGRGGAGMNVSA